MNGPWNGIFAALWTPTDEAGCLLEPQLRSSLQFMFQHGVHGIMALGSTGQFPYLDFTTKQRLLELVLEEAENRPVIVNISHLNAKHMQALSECAQRLGASAVALLPPYFYPVAQPDLVDHFVRVSDWARLPLILYNFPERAGNRIDLETIATVADRVPLAGIKQSGEEFDYHSELVRLGKEKGFAVLTGSDLRLAEAMQMGVTGAIGGLANGVPEVMAHLYDACRGSDDDEVRFLSNRLNEIGKCIEPLEFPYNVAVLIEARGRPVGAPKRPFSSATEQVYRSIIVELRSLLHQWKLI